MARPKATNPPTPRKKTRPALSPEAREQQLIGLAVDLVEQRLLDGTASSQETTHFLKLATTKSRLERERLAQEVELMKAKTHAIKSAEETEKLYSEAIAAMRVYSGHGEEVLDYDDEDY